PAHVSLVPQPPPASRRSDSLSLHDALPILLLCWLALSVGAQSQSDYTGFLEGALSAAKQGDEKAFQTRLRYFATAIERSNIAPQDRKSTRLNSSHVKISYAVFCLKKKNTTR